MAVWETFQNTIGRRQDGYYVRLPWKNEASTLPDNKGMAIKRLQATIAKLTQDSAIFHQYHDTIIQQLDQNIIEKVDESRHADGRVVHYLPHRAVLTPHKETTKLRIVYDASAHMKKAPSLNDVLYQGPVLLPQLCSILLRFRIGNMAIVSDVEKAYLQIKLHEQDRDATRFLWLCDISQPPEPSNIITYRFTRVTFGLNCSPFLLAGTIHYHLNNYNSNANLAKHLIDNTYVDNVILTTTTTQEALQTYNESKQIFSDMGMNLREFLSNDQQFMQQIPRQDASANHQQKVLGITWCSKKDEFRLSCQYPQKTKLTKRTVAEQVAAIYDPVGWLTPLTLRGKLFLQHLWNYEYTWDSKLSDEHSEQWNKIVQDVNGVEITIPRRIAEIGVQSKLVLFADASKQCMATCAYIVSNNESHLLVGKSKLPSLKDNPTIPKLELNALTMATRLAHSILTALKGYAPITDITILSDSEIALGWIRSVKAEKEQGVLVKNRLKEIRRIVEDMDIPVQFGYVATDQNAADCASRGLSKHELTNHMWWNGPTFIEHPLEQREHRLFSIPSQTNEDESCSVMKITGTTDDGILDWRRYNRLIPATRTMAYVLRFIRRITINVNDGLRKRVETTIPEILVSTSEPYIIAKEHENALKALVRNHQSLYLPVQSGKDLTLANLYRDDSNIVRCKGRLGRANLPANTKRPMLIREDTPLAKIIINDSHLPFHRSTSQTMANVRRKFWIPHLRSAARRVIRKCIPCQKMNNLPYRNPNMSDLPETRVVRTRPFEHIGIDYFAPLTARCHNEIIQAYGIVLTCATTRLVHLEIVKDTTTNGLLLALRRFFARRGVPTTITSDNAPNFTLGEQMLRGVAFQKTMDTSFKSAMATKEIEWRTITPYAPWQGAFYERLIKSVKYSLYKVIRNTVPTFANLETLLIEIEGMLNSRPLTYQEQDPDDLCILRPIDFIQRDIILAYPFEKLTIQDENDDDYLPPEELKRLQRRHELLKAFKSSHQLIERYWTIWSQQYLTALREMHKLHMDNRRSTAMAPAVGAVVLIADPIHPRNTWRMARITKLQRSADGAVREAHLTLPNRRIIRRPINILVPLEIDDTLREDEPTTSVNFKDRDESANSKKDPQNPQKRYNLRPRHNKAAVSSVSQSQPTG